MTDLVVEQRIGASPATVYAYLTDADRWRRWQGVDGLLDPRPGGLFALVMANGMRASGEFVELVPDRRVVFTWGWDAHPGIPPGSTTVEIELRPDGAGTILVLTHRSLPAEEVPEHRAGWVRYLPRLAVAATGGDPGPDPGTAPPPG